MWRWQGLSPRQCVLAWVFLLPFCWKRPVFQEPWWRSHSWYLALTATFPRNVLPWPFLCTKLALTRKLVVKNNEHASSFYRYSYRCSSLSYEWRQAALIPSRLGKSSMGLTWGPRASHSHTLPERCCFVLTHKPSPGGVCLLASIPCTLCQGARLSLSSVLFIFKTKINLKTFNTQMMYYRIVNEK